MKDNFPRELKAAASLIRKSKSVIITCHVNPDGDSIGSLLALGMGLKKLGKKVILLSCDGVPAKYRNLPRASLIRRSFTEPQDLAIAVDCADPRQLGSSKEVILKSSNVLEIDHHLYRKPFGNFRLVKEDMASVGEIIYLLLKELKVAINKEIAENILTSIIVETLSFQLNKVNRLTFSICENLLATKADFYKISQRHYWAESVNSLRLSGLCFYRMKTLKKGALVWSIIFEKDFKKFSASTEDVDSVADKMLSIRGTKVSLLFREAEEGSLRVNLRSKGRIDIGKLAFKYNGGGHFDVASCFLPDKNSALKQFLKEAQALIH